MRIPYEVYGSISPALIIILIFIGIVLATTINLLILRLAMIFPPVRHLVRWIIDSARD